MGRTRNNISKVNSRKNKLSEAETAKNGPVVVEKLASPVSTHTDVFNCAQQPAETTMTEKATTMTVTTKNSNGPSTPTRGANKMNIEVVEVGGGNEDEGTERRQEEPKEKTYVAAATTMTLTTAMVKRTVKKGIIPVKLPIAEAGAKRSSFRKGQGRWSEAKRPPNRPPGHGDTPDAKKRAATTEQTSTRLFEEPIRIQTIAGMDMTIKEAVQRLSKCFSNPFFSTEGMFHGFFGFVFWLEALASQTERSEPRVAFLLRNISSPDQTTVAAGHNSILFRLLATNGRFATGEVVQMILRHRIKQDGVALLWNLLEYYGTPDSLDWALVQMSLDIDEAIHKEELECWDGEWTTYAKWHAPIAKRLTAPLFRPLKKQEQNIQDHSRLLASQWALWTMLEATMREGKAKDLIAQNTYKSGYVLYQELAFQHKYALVASPDTTNKPLVEITPEEDKWLMEEDEETVVAGQEGATNEVSSLQPRRLYNHRFKLTVTGTGHEQRSKGFATVVGAISQMLVDIKEVTSSQPVLRPWRLSNKESPTISEPRGVPKSESGLAPYLFDRFWDKVSGNYYAEIFLGFDGKPPVELATLTRTEGATVDQLPYYLTDRTIQDDSVECAGWLLGSTMVTDQERLVKALADAVRPLSVDVARRRIPVPGENPIKKKMIFAFRIFGSSVQKNELATKLTALYPFEADKRGLDGKSFIFIPDASFYASNTSVRNYDKLRDRQDTLERRLRTETIADLKAECLDTELDEAGNTMRNFLQSLLGPGNSKEKYLLHNVDVHDNVVKFQCFPNHHQSVTTICSSLLTYMEYILRNHRKGEAQEVFLKKLRKCFTSTAREFASSCKWNDRKQTMETPADKHMELIMQAVLGRDAFDMSEKEVAPKSGIRVRQDDHSSMTTQASLGLDLNCVNREVLDKVVVVKDSIPSGVNAQLEGERQPKKPRPNAREHVQQDIEREEQQRDIKKRNWKETEGGEKGTDGLSYMEREMDKMQDIVKYLQTEVQHGKDKLEEGKEREGKLQAEVHRLTLQLAATNAAQGDNAGKQPATLREVPDVDMSASEEIETSTGMGNGTPDAPIAMDTGTLRKVPVERLRTYRGLATGQC